MGVIAAVALPFLLLGMAIGYSLSAKAALPVEVVLFPLAFGGGLFMPPQAFPGWLDSILQALLSRRSWWAGASRSRPWPRGPTAATRAAASADRRPPTLDIRPPAESVHLR